MKYNMREIFLRFAEETTICILEQYPNEFYELEEFGFSLSWNLYCQEFYKKIDEFHKILDLFNLRGLMAAKYNIENRISLMSLKENQSKLNKTGGEKCLDSKRR